MTPALSTNSRHTSRLQTLVAQIETWGHTAELGEIVSVGRTALRARFLQVGLGAICRIVSGPATGLLTEVIAIDGKDTTLSVLGESTQIRVGDRVEYLSNGLEFPMTNDLLGSVLDGVGQPLSGAAHRAGTRHVRALNAQTISALDRPVIQDTFLTGIPAIDCFITLGQGQRIALFGPPGSGKSVLLANIISNCSADVIVMALVGERAREVQEFLTRHLPADTRNNTVMVVSTSDRPALERIYAAHVASAIAEEYRDAGKNVLLIVDSLTRTARALREIGLAAGEPAVRRGYPASVYPALPKIIERAGRTEKGSITAIYSVLVEGDSVTDPIADEIKSLTDGHIELCRELAAAGHFPAIDVRKSLSRLMSDIVPPQHMDMARKTRGILATYEELKLLIQIGEYEQGQDASADDAIAKIKPLRDLIHPAGSEPKASLQSKLSQLHDILEA